MIQGYWPSGGIYSNIEDMLQYGHLLIDSYKGHEKGSELISQITLKQLWATQVRDDGSSPFYVHFDYGLGGFVARNNPNMMRQHIVGHQSGLLDANAMLLIHPDKEIVGVALTNRGGLRELDLMIMYTVENVYDLVN